MLPAAGDAPAVAPAVAPDTNPDEITRENIAAALAAENAAAIKVQKIWRGEKGRKAADEEAKSLEQFKSDAELINATQQKYMKKKEEEKKKQEEKEERAAIKVQNIWRGKQEHEKKKQEEKEKAAAEFLQRNWRGKQGRDASIRLQEEEEKAKAKRQRIRKHRQNRPGVTTAAPELAGSSTKIIDTENLKEDATEIAKSTFNGLLSQINSKLQKFKTGGDKKEELTKLLELLIYFNWNVETLRNICEFYKEYKKNEEREPKDKDWTLNGELYTLLKINPTTTTTKTN
jgi:hypothetical protein